MVIGGLRYDRLDALSAAEMHYFLSIHLVTSFNIEAWVDCSAYPCVKEVSELCLSSQNGDRYLDLDLMIFPPLAWFSCSLCLCFRTRSELRP